MNVPQLQMFFSNGVQKLILVILLVFCAVFSTAAFDQDSSAPSVKQLLADASRAAKNGDFSAAEKIFRQIVSIEPDNESHQLRLAYILLKQDKLEEAFRYAQEVYRRLAPAVIADPCLGRSQFNESKNTDCSEFLPTSNRMASKAHAIAAMTLLRAGNFTDAAKDFRASYSLNKHEPFANAGLGLLEFYNNRGKTALILMTRAAEAEPREPDFQYYLGQIAARNEKYRVAANAYSQFLQIAPKLDTDRRARIQGLVDFFKYLGGKNALIVTGGAKTTSVPFELVNNRPILEVSLNNSSKKFRFVLDTGAGITVISKTTANELGLSPIARGGQARAVGGDGRFEIVYGFLDAIEIGSAKMSNVPVYIREFISTGGDGKIDGYIGISLLSKFLVEIDYANKTFALNLLPKPKKDFSDKLITLNEKIASVEADGTLNVPLRLTTSGFLSGEVRLKGLDFPVNFIIDTGASITVVTDELVSISTLQNLRSKARTRIYGAAGLKENVDILHLPEISLGGAVKSGLSAVILDLSAVNETAGFEQGGIIGGDFLRHYKMTLNSRDAVLRLLPNLPSTAPRR